MNARRPPAVFGWMATACFAALVAASQFLPSNDRMWLRVGGIASIVAAALLAIPAFGHLTTFGRGTPGRRLVDTTALVDTGAYAVVRHPLYLGYAFLVLGLVLLSLNAATALLGSLTVVTLYLQAVREEAFCLERLGEQYRAYARRVPRYNVVAGIVRFVRRRRAAGLS